MMKNKVQIITLAVLATVVIIFVFGAVRGNKVSEIRNYPSPGESIVALGDSLVQGVGADTEGGFVTLLSERLGLPIENLGRGGDTTESALDRIDSVLEKNPKVVIVLLGGNDYLSRRAKEDVFANLAEIIERIQDTGAVVIKINNRLMFQRVKGMIGGLTKNV